MFLQHTMGVRPGLGCSQCRLESTHTVNNTGYVCCRHKYLCYTTEQVLLLRNMCGLYLVHV